jgi:hypothetical protein
MNEVFFFLLLVFFYYGGRAFVLPFLLFFTCLSALQLIYRRRFLVAVVRALALLSSAPWVVVSSIILSG